MTGSVEAEPSDPTHTQKCQSRFRQSLSATLTKESVSIDPSSNGDTIWRDDTDGATLERTEGESKERLKDTNADVVNTRGTAELQKRLWDDVY